MAYSWSESIYPAGATQIAVDIEYLDKSYIHLYLDDVEVADSGYSWASDQLIELNVPLATSQRVLLVRRTDKEFLYIAFAEGAAFIRENIDTQNKQFLHLAQELVEGRSIEGFYGNLSMNGYRITNLGAGVNPTDAVNKQQLDVQADRITALENTFISDTSSYPWYTITTAETDLITPPFQFNKASLFLNGICQTPGYSYEVVDNTIMLADPVRPGTHVFVRVGEDVPNDSGYATAAQLAALATQFTELGADLDSETAARMAADQTLATGIQQGQTDLNTYKTQVTTALAGKAATGVNSDITALTALSTAITVAQGGTGADNAASARTNLGAAARGANLDITSLTGLDTNGVKGIVSGGTPSAGYLGEVLSATTGTGVALTTGTETSLVSLALTPGYWLVSGSVRITTAASTTVTDSIGGINTSAALPAWPQTARVGSSLPASSLHVLTVPPRVVNVSANTTVYAVARATFASGSVTGDGYIQAVRIK